MARQCLGRLAFFAEMSLELPVRVHRSGLPSARERLGLNPFGTPLGISKEYIQGHLRLFLL